jgi:fructose-1,6-bisphosphatase/inositol monophosphatase family enzyme
VFNFDTAPWDVAAGTYLVRAAGGSYQALDNSGVKATGRPWLASNFVACASGFAIEGKRMRELIANYLSTRQAKER